MVKQHSYDEEFKKQVVKDHLSSASSLRSTHKKHDISRSTLRDWVNKYRHQIEYGIKDDQLLRAVSTYTPIRDDEGNLIEARWTKVDIKHEEQVDRLRGVAEGLVDTIRPIESREFKGACQNALLSNYIISDFHLGQYSSKSETGEEWNLDTAFNVVCAWIKSAITASPKSKQAVLCDLGDWLHQDGFLPLTPASKHVLDSSGRFHEHIDASIAAFDYMIDALLDHHEHVHVLICEGNHNESSAHWMSRCIARKYENEPRVTFDLSDLPYYSYEWGATGLFYHHGHKKKINQVTEPLIANFREMYGRTKYHYGHVGHLHHREVKENALMVIEQHSTLAAKDAYSARGGYHSERGASVITYHKDFGEVARATIRPEMLI